MTKIYYNTSCKKYFTLSLPDVECYGEVYDGDDDVGDGGEDVEDEVGHEVVDAAGAAVHHTEHLASLPRHVPAEGEVVEVLEEADLGLPCDELLDLDPEQGPGVVEEALAHAAPLQRLQHHPHHHLAPGPHRQLHLQPGGGESVHNLLVVYRHKHVGHPHPRQQQEAEEQLKNWKIFE